jgi:hypothetical protein
MSAEERTMHERNVSRMTAATLLLASGTAWLALFGAVQAQQATEQYIPIGESPGVSDGYSLIGELVAVQLQSREISVATNTGRRTFDVAKTTRIWLDRSQLGRASTEASFADCEVGRLVEVTPRRDDASVALWIKIRAE